MEKLLRLSKHGWENWEQGIEEKKSKLWLWGSDWEKKDGDQGKKDGDQGEQDGDQGKQEQWKPGLLIFIFPNFKQFHGFSALTQEFFHAWTWLYQGKSMPRKSKASESFGASIDSPFALWFIQIKTQLWNNHTWKLFQLHSGRDFGSPKGQGCCCQPQWF